MALRQPKSLHYVDRPERHEKLVHATDVLMLLQREDGKRLRWCADMNFFSDNICAPIAKQAGQDWSILLGRVSHKEVNIASLGGVVEDGQDALLFRFSQETVGGLIGKNVPQMSLAQSGVCTTQAK